MKIVKHTVALIMIIDNVNIIVISDKEQLSTQRTNQNFTSYDTKLAANFEK